MNIQPFNQSAPELGNQYDEDRVLRSYLRRALPQEVQQAIEPALREMGALSGGELYRLQLADRLNEPVLTNWDAWGNRIDQIEVSPLWQRAEKLAAEFGLVAAAYEGKYGRFDRTHQFALAYLFHPSSDVYTCPLAMTDGATRTLLNSSNQPLIDRAIPHLTSRDPATFWTSGQWMTESTGGSDVGLSETVARLEDGVWRLYGRKWFTSATTSPMSLTLARPEGSPPGGKGLALFYVEVWDETGALQNITVHRLKDKLGTRKVPTAELSMNGTPAIPVLELANGVRNIVPMLHLTRTWNAVSAVGFMRRGLALARDYARRRHAFGAVLAHKPLHVDTLATMQAEFEAAFHLTFFLVELIGREESGDMPAEQADLLRLLTSLAKLTTGKQGVVVASEVLEAFGGAGYVEDTGLPVLLRDSQVLPIWEGTTNVLALDALRAISKDESLEALKDQVSRSAAAAKDGRLQAMGELAKTAVAHAERWLFQAMQLGLPAVEAGARRFGLTLGRALSLALLTEHAQWSLEVEGDGRALAAALRFAQTGVDTIVEDVDAKMARALANDEPIE
ncbi:MAG: acyl-CoA dehydrogenase family protein [Ardenticatenaceae bacterium]|nr:acyl-CoA dehydrogenase family protein [Anaerolineales bacterium]MCB8921225.1 acyl-CoA dehydrogenase family protein [Ardenticatenaceae bacterium]MCB9004298.1 acyl-CoA dehydrogenase family protein [Ardenticatenaceae bacterium]